MVAAICLLALSSLSPQLVEIDFPECSCKISGIERAEWTPEDFCRIYCPRPGDDSSKRLELQKRCLRELNSLYPQYGFLDAHVDCQITEDEKGGTELRIRVEEGPRYVVGKIDIDVQEGKFDLVTLRERLRIHPGEACNPQFVTISQMALNSTIAIALADPELGKVPNHFQGNKYVTDVEYTKHPGPELVDLCYTVKLPPNAHVRTEPIWTPLYPLLRPDGIHAMFTGFWLRDSLDRDTKLLIGAVNLKNSGEDTLNVGDVSLLTDDNRLEALSSARVRELWDESLPSELPRPDSYPEFGPLLAEGLVARNLAGRTLSPSSEAVYAISFAVSDDLPRKLTLEFGEFGSIILGNPAMKAE